MSNAEVTFRMNLLFVKCHSDEVKAMHLWLLLTFFSALNCFQQHVNTCIVDTVLSN